MKSKISKQKNINKNSAFRIFKKMRYNANDIPLIKVFLWSNRSTKGYFVWRLLFLYVALRDYFFLG